jgi:hypothetical protein
VHPVIAQVVQLETPLKIVPVGQAQEPLLTTKGALHVAQILFELHCEQKDSEHVTQLFEVALIVVPEGQEQTPPESTVPFMHPEMQTFILEQPPPQISGQATSI